MSVPFHPQLFLAYLNDVKAGYRPLGSDALERQKTLAKNQLEFVVEQIKRLDQPAQTAVEEALVHELFALTLQVRLTLVKLEQRQLKTSGTGRETSKATANHHRSEIMGAMMEFLDSQNHAEVDAVLVAMLRGETHVFDVTL